MTPRQKLILIATAIFMGVLLLVLVFGDNGLLELNHRRATQADLRQTNDRLIQENVRLNRTIERLRHDPDFVEALARRELGMIRADERIFQFKPGNPAGAP